MRGVSNQVGAGFAVDRAEREVEPAVRTGERLRERVAREEADGARLERVALQRATDHAAVEHERVHRDTREAEAESVEDGDERDHFASRCRSPRSTSLIAISEGE